MKKLLTACLFVAIGFFGKAQSQYCSISVIPGDTTICPGDTLMIVANAALINGNQSFNFNGGAIPPGWSAGGGNTFGSPCGPAPDNTPYYWASTSASTPNITTAAFDVTCGGTLQFEMVYSVQSAAAPCEGPDQANEGVALQYSTDGGVTWNTITYYQPDGQILSTVTVSTVPGVGPGQQTPFTTWGTYSVNIPPGALSTATAFRWIQLNSSSSAFDNWGLDNVFVNAQGLPCDQNAIVNWSNGLMDTTSWNLVTYSDTTFIAMVYDTAGNFYCQSAPITVSVHQNTMSYSLVDTVYSYCPTTNPQVAIENLMNGQAPFTYSWDVPSNNDTVQLSTGGAQHDTLQYNVVVTDFCGYTRADSVVLIVNQLLSIDSLVSITASACDDDGVVLAFVSGVTVNSGQPFYEWSGPGANNPNNINSTVWTDRSPGYYYFTVTDDVCTEFDSVLVNVLPPPNAALSVDPSSGCAPFNATFSNNSSNATTYVWNFGNGNTLTTNDTSAQTQTYSDNATIELIAYSSPTCADTAYISVSTVICGCTNPLALNFNPLAAVEDGSCILPEPIVVVPNVFTPNGDGENDVFMLDTQYASSITMTITNRWGQVVFEGTSNNLAWDGKTQNGGLAADGVYFLQYTVDNLYKTKSISGQGFVHLVRN